MRSTEISHSSPSDRRYLVLAICCLGLLMVSMDATIVNVALPSIRREFGAPLSDLQWVVDSYTLVLASLLIISGSTADRLGRKRTFQVGLVVFVVASALCGIAVSVKWLIAFRMLQAVGGSMLNPVALSIIVNIFIDPQERARAIGIWSGVVGISMGLGPLIGGLLIQSVNWRWVFWINIPVGFVAFTLAARYISESRATITRKSDPLGQVFLSTGLAGMTYTIIEGPTRGWTNPVILCSGAVSALAFVAFACWELKTSSPLIQPTFFRSVPFCGAITTAILFFIAFGGFLFTLTLYLQDVRGFGPLSAGVSIVPMAVLILVMSPWSGWIVSRFGARIPLVSAGIALSLTGVLLLRLSPHSSTVWILLCTAMFGLAFGLVNPPITNAAVAGMPRDQAGVAAATTSTSRQLGATLGVAILGSIIASGPADSVTGKFAHNAPTVFCVMIAIGVTVAGIGYFITGRPALQTADAVAARGTNIGLREGDRSR